MKVAGAWRHVYRAIDEDGQVVDCCTSGAIFSRLRSMRRFKKLGTAALFCQAHGFPFNWSSKSVAKVMTECARPLTVAA